MPASKSVTELTQVAARAIADKFGTEMIAIDLSDQMVLSEVFLIATGANIRQVDAIADEVNKLTILIGDIIVGFEEDQISCRQTLCVLYQAVRF